MRITLFAVTLVLVLLAAPVAAEVSGVLPDIEKDAQAVSLFGKPRYPSEPDADTLARFAEAEKSYRDDPGDADKIIWYGRRTAYAGKYRQAIRIFTEGIEKHPRDARMYRHRGHRYISIREFDRAIADLEEAMHLIEGTENRIEPDGLPNALDIPVSTLHGNIWYHLGLAYYLKHDWKNALRAYDAAYNVGGNDDNRVSTTHWRYMILRRMGIDRDEASAVLEPITADMRVIENQSYHRLCLFYKGELSNEEISGDVTGTAGGSAVAYGIANWYLYEGDPERAAQLMQTLVDGEGWDAFGAIAAEADLAAMQRRDVADGQI